MIEAINTPELMAIAGSVVILLCAIKQAGINPNTLPIAINNVVRAMAMRSITILFMCFICCES